MSKLNVALLGACAASALVGASCRGPNASTDDVAPANGLPGVKMQTSADAAALVERARMLHTAGAPSMRHPRTDRDVPEAISVLGMSEADAAHNDGAVIRPHFRGGAARSAVTLPPSSDGRRALALKSGDAVTVGLANAAPASAEYASGYVVYRGGLGAAGDVLVRPTRDGFEDYFYFERKPATASVEYSLSLPRSVAGLRLSSNILELVDASGIPLMHASPPLLVDSAGKTTQATLSVSGCSVDRSAQPTFHRRPTAPGAAKCRISVTWDDAAVHYPALLDPAWEAASAMPMASAFYEEAMLASSAPQRIVAFGYYVNGAVLNTTVFFDVDSGTWSAGPPTNVARVGGTSVSFNNTGNNSSTGAQLFVSGGESFDSSKNLVIEASTEILAADANGNWAWKSSAPMQKARWAHSATVMPTSTGNQILLAGGWGVDGHSTGCDPGPTAVSAELYDTVTGSFVSPAPPNLPGPVFDAGAGLSADGQAVILLSGYNGGVDQPVHYCSGSTAVFAYRAGQWQTLPSMPSYRINPQVTRLNDGRFIAVGGAGYTDATQQTCVQKTDTTVFTYSSAPPYGSWASADPMPTSGIGAFTTLANGAVMLAGIGTDSGCDTPPTPTTEVDLFDPATGHWSRTAASAVGHYGAGLHAATTSSGQEEAVLFGGATAYDATTGWNETSTTEIFPLGAVGGTCTVGPECASGICLGGLCQSPGSPISINATGLSHKGLAIPGALGGVAFDTTQARPINFAPGTYTVQIAPGVASVATFIVNSDGTLDYDPALENVVLTGRGGTQLTILGRPITVDATHLTQPQLQIVAYNFTGGTENDRLSFPTNAAQTLALLPIAGDAYQFAADSAVASLAFGVDTSGDVHIPPEDANLAGGDGTPKLTIYGTQMTATVPDGVGTVSIGNVVLPPGQTTTTFVVPGQQTVKLGDQTATVNVDVAGNIHGNATLISMLDLHGTGPSACGMQNSGGVASGWNATPLLCSGDTVEDDNGIEAATPAVTPAARLSGRGRFPNELPRFRRAAGGDPVMGDGEFTIQRTDLEYGGAQLHYQFSRSYRSGFESDSPLGSGWDHNYDQRVIGKVVWDPYDDLQLPYAGDVIAPLCDNTVQVQDGTGNLVLFKADAWYAIPNPSTIYYPGTTTPFYGSYQHFWNQTKEIELEYFPSISGTNPSFWRMLRNDGSTVTVFDSAGFIYSITNAAGNAITFQWERATAAPYPDCSGLTVQKCNSARAAWRNSLTRAPIGQQRRLQWVTDPVRRLYYRYTTAAIWPGSPLSCITAVFEDTTCQYPLLSFLWTNGRFTGVTHGDATTTVVESYRYHAPVTDANCMASADIPSYCTRLCASPTVDCLGGNYDAAVQNECPNLNCTPLEPGQRCLQSHRIYKGNHIPGPALCCSNEPADDPSLCISYMYGGPNCHDGCEYSNQCTQMRGSTNTAVYAAGSGKELNNDITDVYDSKGNLVVHNDYGEDISTVSFDKVVTQTMTSSSKDNVIKFEYHDLDIEKNNGVGTVYIDPSGSGIVAATTQYSVPDARVTQYALQDGVAINLCPRVCPNGAASCSVYDYNPAIFTEPQPHPFDMKSATVIHDLHNVTRVQFLDQYTDLVREVVLESNEVTDYNYMNPNGTGPGLLSGIRDASGVRTCIERDLRQRVVQSSRVAAAGFAGSTPTQATTIAYDPFGRVRTVTKDALVAPASTVYGRDPLGRVQTIDEDVGGGKPALHTIYKYDGEAPPKGFAALESPTSITYPNGRIDTFSGFTPTGGGPATTVIDVKAADFSEVPEQRYTKYDTFGRVREEGEVNRFAKHYMYDDAGGDMLRLTGYGHRSDANSPWIDTTVASHVVDGEVVVDALVEPTRTTTFTTVGRYVTQKTLTATVAPAGTTLPAPQTSCESRAPDGRFEAAILPEGNGMLYTYPTPDLNGHTETKQRGFDVPTTDAWAQGCAGHTKPAGDPGLSAAYGAHYRAGGFLDTATDEQLRTRKYSTDGFGRTIQVEAVPNPSHADEIPVSRFGYDSKGNRIWEAIYKPGTTLSSDPYQQPNLSDPALLSYSATEYDLQGRVTKKHQYVLETGDDLLQSWDRNDQTRETIVTDRSRSESMTYDYRGRLVSDSTPDQSNRLIIHGLGVDTIITNLNQGGPLKRVYNYDTRGRLLNIQDNRGASNPFYVATYDDDGNKLTEQQRGLGQTTWKFDSFGRRVEEDRPRGATTAATTYEYDGDNRMTATVDAETHRWEMTFTGTDAPLTIKDPLKRVGTYTYIAGWPQSLAAMRTEPNGRVTSYTYDSEARPLDLYNGNCGSPRDPWTCSVSALVSQQHTIYDERGMAKEIDGGPVNPTPVYYTHDSIGRVLTETVGTSTVVSHPFTDLGYTQTTQITHGGWSATMKHKYDTSNRLSTVEVAGQAQPVMATYDYGQGAGGPITLSYANGATARYTYDDMLRQTGMDVSFLPAGATTATPIASLHQSYGPDSIQRLRQSQFMTDAAVTNVFEVDSDGRIGAENLNLSGITLPAGEVDNSGVDSYIKRQGPTWRQYTLDNIDNIKQKTTRPALTLVNTIFGMDALSRVTSVGNRPVAHDATDNIDVNGTLDPVTFAFDPFKGIATSAKSSTGTTTFHYDALGRRLSVSVAKRPDVHYLWDGSKLIGHGPEAALVLDVPGDDVDSHIVSIDKFGAGTSRRFYHQAPDESTIALSDGGGFVEGYSYSAFGEASVWTKSGQQPSDNIFRYQGQVFDAATGTYAMRARQYRPDWGRFVSPDPLSSKGTSPFSFTSSRPLHYRDPSGMLPTIGETWLRNWMASWDTPFGTPPWEGGFGGDGRDMAETWRFGQGMGDMGSLWYDPNSPEFGPEFPGINQALIAKAIDRMANSVRTDPDGFPLGFNKPSYITNEELLFGAHAPPPTMEQIEQFGLADARNLNFSIGNGFGVNVGLLMNDKNEVYWYLGAGATTPGFSFSLTYSLDDFVPGHLSTSLSGGMGLWGAYDQDLYNHSTSYEAGGGWFYSLSYMASYVFPTMLFQLPQLSHPGPYSPLPFWPAYFGDDYYPPGSMSIPEYPGWSAPGVDISRNRPESSGLYK